MPLSSFQKQVTRVNAYSHGVLWRNLVIFRIRNWRSYRKETSVPEVIHLSLHSAFLLKVRFFFPLIWMPIVSEVFDNLTFGSLTLCWCWAGEFHHCRVFSGVRTPYSQRIFRLLFFPWMQQHFALLPEPVLPAADHSSQWKSSRLSKVISCFMTQHIQCSGKHCETPNV